MRGVFAVLVVRPVPLLPAALISPALICTSRVWRIGVPIGLARSLALLGGGLVHQVQHPKIMLGMLKITLRRHSVSAARGVPAKLQIFLKQLLGCPADTDVWSIAVEDMVAVEWDAAPGMEANTTATTSPATTTTAAPAA